MKCERCSENANKKNTLRSEKQIKDVENRINRICGQLTGVKNMVKENRYCADVLIQLSAVSKAVKSLAVVIMDEHLKTCVVEKIQGGEVEVMNEICELFKKF